MRWVSRHFPAAFMSRVAAVLALVVGVAAVVYVLRGYGGAGKKAGRIVFPPPIHGVYKHQRLQFANESKRSQELIFNSSQLEV